MHYSRLETPCQGRSAERNRVTLIAGFRCTDGAIICADSQETVGDYRVNVHKLLPFQAGNFQIGIAGSGNDGELIDGFIQRLGDRLGDSSLATLGEFKEFTQSELLDFSRSEASNYPAKSRRMSFLLCARTTTGAPAFDMRYTAACRLIRVLPRKLVGWDIDLYKHAVDQFYSSPSEILPISQTIFLALRLFGLARSTSRYIGGPTTVVIARNDGIWAEAPEWIEKLEDRVVLFDAQFRNLMTACPDTSVSSEEFLKRAAEFQETLIHLRSEYLIDVAAGVLENLGNSRFTGNLMLPRGSAITLMADGSLIVRPRSTEEIAQLRAIHESIRALDAATPGALRAQSDDDGEQST